MRIRLVVPFPLDPAGLEARMSRIPPGALGPEVVVEPLAVGHATELGSDFEDTRRAIAVVDAAAAAEEQGYDAVVIDSIADPGLYALRSRVSIPVVGPGLAAYTLAITLGPSFSVLAPIRFSGHGIEKALRLYGLQDKFVSVREVASGVSEHDAGGAPRLVDELLAEGARATGDDGASVLVLGATAMHETAARLARELACPVIDPGLVAFQTAERIDLLGLSHSKVAFAAPKRVQDAKLGPLIGG